jgi:type IV pilus assembly protein PilC
MAFKLDSISSKKEEKSFDLDSLLKKEITFFSKPFSNKKKEAFYTELSVLLNAGINLKDALTLITEEFKSKKDKALFENLIKEIVNGSNFSSAISITKDFSEYEYYSLKIGEETGTLQKVTQELGLFFRRRNEQKRNIINALTYPIVVLTTALLAVIFMLKFIVPMFADIFKQNNVELPWLTKVIMSFSEGFQKYFSVFLLFIFLLFIFRKMIVKKEWYQKFSTKIILKIPFVGELVRKMFLAQFTQATALLTGAKVPILNSIQLTSNMIPFYPLKKGLLEVEKQILLGKSLSESLQSHSIFDSKMISLIKVADETNQNEFIFKRLTTQYNEEIQHKSKMLSTILEPLIIIVLGAIVAVILIAMYLPMFQLSTVIG